jgi:outer membrane protein OmpA-like peptidoglycan-associated protein
MKLSHSSRIGIGLATALFILALSGCATKKYVGQQIHAVDQRLTNVQTQTNERLEKQQGEISYLNERTETTDHKLAALAGTAQQANDTAGQALQQAQTNASAIQNNASQIDAHSTALAKLVENLNYSVIETENVMFPFNKWQLTNEAKAALDVIIQKAVATSRPLVEVLGYTDDIGSASYNLTLSRRRAEAVARYLVQNKVPLKSISMLGLGEEQTPQVLAAEVENFQPNASKKELRGLARRVRIQLYAPASARSAVAAASTDSTPQQQ